jgi:hypothetical protein
MRIQNRNAYDDGLDDLDPYFTCVEAIASLIALEGDRLPTSLWEPAAGDGAIVHPLRETGRLAIASDIHDYGLGGCAIQDYLTTDPPAGIHGIVTNPPYKHALQFAQKALSEVPYVAFLVRSNFDIEGVKRMGFRASDPPARIWRSARRLPMMHRYGWTGNRAPSNTPHCWLVWEDGAPREFPQDFDWRELLLRSGSDCWGADRFPTPVAVSPMASDASRRTSALHRSDGPRRAPVIPSDVLEQIEVAALIDRLQAFALADTPGSLTDTQAAVALALLDRMVPDLHHVELITTGSAAPADAGSSKIEGG